MFGSTTDQEDSLSLSFGLSIYKYFSISLRGPGTRSNNDHTDNDDDDDGGPSTDVGQIQKFIAPLFSLMTYEQAEATFRFPFPSFHLPVFFPSF